MVDRVAGAAGLAGAYLLERREEAAMLAGVGIDYYTQLERGRARGASDEVLDGIAMTEAPAFVRNGRLDILYANRLGQALYSPAFYSPNRPVNLARFRFLDPSSADFRHPVVGDLTLVFEAMELPADTGLTLTAYCTEPGTRPTTHSSSWPAGSDTQPGGAAQRSSGPAGPGTRPGDK